MGQQRGGHIRRADDAKSFLLEFGHDAFQQAVVAQQPSADMGDEAGGAPVGPELRQAGPRDPAGEDELLDPGRAEPAQGVGYRAQAHPVLGRIGNGLGLGMTAKGDDMKGPPLASAGFDQQPGQLAAAGEYAELRQHRSWVAG